MAIVLPALDRVLTALAPLPAAAQQEKCAVAIWTELGNHALTSGRRGSLSSVLCTVLMGGQRLRAQAGYYACQGREWQIGRLGQWRALCRPRKWPGGGGSSAATAEKKVCPVLFAKHGNCTKANCNRGVHGVAPVKRSGKRAIAAVDAEDEDEDE
ncbi:hypothetical protein T492DRAFT_1128956 [Pavlovales sp. CCMP2436]|nr:hypothetical protein T492DRAFT_1128956 [Pavlovales sp. CCMP2436]